MIHENNITNATNYPPAAPLGEEQRNSQSQRRRLSYSCCCCPTSSGSSGDDGLLQLSDGMVRVIFLLLGIGILIPWNAFVNAKPYFTARLCQQRQSSQSGHQAHDIVNFEQWFGLVWNVSSVLSLGLIIAGQSFSDYWNQKDAQSLPPSNVDGIINDTAATTPTHDSNLVEEPTRSEDRTSSLNTHSRARTGNDRPHCSSSSSSLINGTRSGSSSKNDRSFYNVVVPLGLYTLVFSIQAVLVTVPDMSPTHFLIVTLLSLAVCGTCGAIATAGIVSTAGQFAPHLAIHPFFSGQAVGGAAVALANFAASALGEDPEEYFEKYCGSSSMTNNDIEEAPMLLSTHHLSGISRSTQRWLENDVDADSSSCSPYQNLDWAVLFYFLAGCLVLFLCIVGYLKVHQYQNTRHRYVYETVGDRHGDRPVTNSSSSSGVSYHDESPRIGLELNDRILRRGQMESASSSDTENDDENQIEQDIFNDETEEEDTDSDNGPTSLLLPVIRGPAACIFLTFSLTLSLFPSWVSELKSSHACENRYNRLDNDLYVPLSFVVFNFGDLVGRLVSGYIPVQHIRYVSQKLVAGALLRTLLLPAFLLCSTTMGGSENSSMVIQNDFFSLAVQLLFAISNGLLISKSFMWFSRLVGTEDAALHKRASDIMTFSLSFGLLCGSFLAFPLLRLAAHLLLKQ